MSPDTVLVIVSSFECFQILSLWIYSLGILSLWIYSLWTVSLWILHAIDP